MSILSPIGINPYNLKLGEKFPSKNGKYDSNELGHLSVIIPNYNGSRFLRPLLEQLVETGIELIVIDGGSTDGSLDILSDYSAYLAYWVSEPDEGQADAISKGVLKATRPYIAYQNSDDLFDLDALSKGIKKAREHRLDVLFGPIGRIDEHQVLFDIQDYSRFTKFSSLFSIPFNNQSLILKRELALEYPINKSFQFCFDLELSVRIILKKNIRIRRYPFVIGALRHHMESKTANLQNIQEKERRAIEKKYGRPVFQYKNIFFKVFRVLECLASGNSWYLTRGFHSARRKSREVDGRCDAH